MPCVDPCQRLFCGGTKLAHNSVNMGIFTYSLAILQVDEFCPSKSSKSSGRRHLPCLELGVDVFTFKYV